MATSQRGLSSTLRGGSDELFDFCCQPCSTENLNVEATGFCQQCQECLCDSCCRHHRKLKATNHHTILDKAAMPKTAVPPRVADVLTETCPKHLGKVLEYFCKDQGQICCSVCLNLDHSSCKNKSYVPDVSDGTARSKEYIDQLETLDRLVAMATSEKMQVKVNERENEQCRTNALDNIEKCRKEMHGILDQIVDETVETVTRLYTANSDEIQTSGQKCQSVLSDVEAITTDLEKKANASMNNQLFVDVKLTRLRLPAIEKDIKDISGRTFSHFKFDKDEKVQELQSLLSAMLTLSVRKVGAEPEARYLQEVNVKSEDDKKDCLINGIVVMATDRLVVTDYNNAAVKLVDVQRDRVLSRLSLSSVPHDVVRTAPSTVAVALSNERKIEMVAVSDVLTRSRTINVSGTTFSSLCYINDEHANNLLVLSGTARAVKTVDMSGRVLSTVYKDNDTGPMFQNPRYITMDNVLSIIYITDREANTVTTMTLKGHVINVYKNDKLKCPRVVTVGRDGAVYVCSKNTNNVHQLSATGQHVKILLDQQRGLATYPWAIAYDEDGSRLCVSSSSVKPEECNYVRLFLLE